jgi:tRNA nucleotidyltransferase (CCA-adding enzyme)
VLSLFHSIKKVLSWHDLLFLEEPYMKWAVYLLGLMQQCDEEISEQICKNLELAPRHRSIFIKERFDAEKCLFWLRQNLPIKNSELYQLLSGFRVELLLYMMAIAAPEKVKKSLSQYITQLRHITTSLTGKDLKKMGLEPGPIYKETLQAVLDAKLNGLVRTRNDELNFARNYVS